MRYRSPTERLVQLQAAIDRLFGQFAQYMREDGTRLDMGELTEIYADHLDMPELNRVVKRMNEVAGPPGERARQPQTTRRETVRTGRSSQGNPLAGLNSLPGLNTGGGNGQGQVG
jgi:hypothetical protein